MIRGVLRTPLLGVATLACAAAGCAGAIPVRAPSAPVADVRAAGKTSTDGEVVGRWTLAEMLAPGGTANDARAARTRLETLPHEGMWASTARALFDDAHGDPHAAAGAFVSALAACAASTASEAPLVAWFAVHHLLALRGPVTNLYAEHHAVFDSLLAHPGRIGWRAVADLEEWRAAEAYDRAERTGTAFDDAVAQEMGCARGLRIAGPFGHGAEHDGERSFPPEDAAPWPPAWAPDPMRGSVPHILSVKQPRCLAVAQEQVEEGVFYVETFFTTRGDRELVVAVQGAVDVWIDGTEVLQRSPHDWGSWQRFGAHVSVVDGRHRVLARTLTPAASIRLLQPDGTSAQLQGESDPSAGFTLQPPTVLEDPNPIDALVHSVAEGNASGVDPIAMALAAYAANVDEMNDVASALVEPLVTPSNAAPLALEMASVFAAGDPAWPDDARGPRARTLRERALAGDARLWRADLAAILDAALQHGLSDGVEPLRKLVSSVPNEPQVLEQLAQLYARLGWKGEQARALGELAMRFPDDVGALHAYLETLDDVGPAAEADRIAARIKKLDPDSEVDLDRALSRRDYPAAIQELERLGKRRPDRKDIANRIADVLARSGNPSAAAAELEKALSQHPRDEQARFRLADRDLAKGDGAALRRALAGAIEAKASTDDLRAAIDLIEGATDLEPFRQDGRAVIRSYQAWEAAGHHMDGTAARVLDYSAIWVHDDGSSEMLEHEIQKIQSQEAINAESEAEAPAGLILHVRVIKPDGRVLEPEPVAGKPTLTMPHLEVGDFLEIEHITSQAGDGARGRQYVSPHWFFREADKGYWRSEFVMVTPAARKLDIETRGSVPPPSTRPLGTFVERRWRVDLSPPAELEPESPPITEFLPSVRVGWGVSLDATLARLVDLASDATPLDPRLRAIALGIVHDAPASSTDERARRLYRWVLQHVQQGKETDGRRTLNGRSGSLQSAFRYMLRLVGIDSELALVKNRLATPPNGAMSEVEQFDALVVRVPTDRGVRWMTVHDKFAPFGYVPAEWRDQPAIRLVGGMPRETVRAPGAIDRVAYDGRADVHEDGSAQLELTLTFDGSRAIAWRTALDQVPQAKLYDFVERELLASSFDGAHVRELTTDAGDALDKPLVIHLRVEVPEFAKPVTGGLSLRPPFAPTLAQLAALPTRRTPLLRGASWRAEVRMHVVLPASTRMPSALPKAQLHDGDATVAVNDVVNGHALDFNRTIDLPSGRVQPGDEYAAWQRFLQQADALVSRDVLVGR
jgi:tetratricopeptide (TPR) repeat protein